mmetsp:Transcript_439/g.1046  ORF Transcript_439/g.1046 Transcript_439/m.1046 type:complete len:405 (-) Transcript_439:145-1359(-)
MVDYCGNTAEFLPDFFSSYYEEPWLGQCAKGACELGVCVCNDGWTGYADFINTEGIECQINNIVIKILWAFNLVFLLVTVFSVRHDIATKRNQHLDVVNQKNLQGRKYTWWDNKGYAAIVVWLALCFPANLILAIIKLATNNQRVGHTWAMTILFFIAKTGFYSSASIFQPQLLATILKGSRSQTALVTSARYWGLANLIISVVVGILPVITAAASVDGRDAVAQGVYIGYMAGSVFSMFVFGLQAIVIHVQFKKIMGSELASKSTTRAGEIQKKLFHFQRQTYSQAAVQGVIYAIFLFIPALWNKHDYFLPISWISFHLLFRKMSTSTITTKNIGESTTDSLSKSKDDNSFSTSKVGKAEFSSFVATHGAPSVSSPPTDFRSFQEKAVSFHAPIHSDDEEEYV